MFYILSFLLSWLCGMLVILVTAFFTYDQFSIIDITSFAVFTFAGFLVFFLLIYLLVLKTITKKISGKQFLFYPFVFAALANLPAYFLVWKNIPEYYGEGEATLFTLGFVAMALVYGTLWAWRNKIIVTKRKAPG